MHPSRSAPASFRDRTNEFRSAVESARRRVAPSPAAACPLGDARSAASAQSEFTNRASRIGLGIHHTSQKLDRLAKLAKRASAFDDPALEIQELTALVHKDLGALNSAVMDLQALCNSQNRSGDLSEDTAKHSTEVVGGLQKRLMSATQEFKSVLTTRTESLKVCENRRQMFSSSAAKDASNPFMRQGPLVAREASGSAPPAPWASDSATTPLFQKKKTNGDHGASSSSSSSSTPAFMQQQLAVQQDSYMQSRADALQNVESTVHELSNIFRQLATMVSQQGELAIRIDEDTEITRANVEGAQGQLLKHLNSISSNRWLVMKIFFVLMVFLMIFIFFVA